MTQLPSLNEAEAAVLREIGNRRITQTDFWALCDLNGVDPVHLVGQGWVEIMGKHCEYRPLTVLGRAALAQWEEENRK